MAVSAAQQDDKKKALNLAISQIEKTLRQGLDHADGGGRAEGARGVHPDRRHQPRRRDRRRRHPPRPRHRDLRPGVERQDHALSARRGQRAEGRRRRRPSSTPSTRSTRSTPRKLGVDIEKLLVSQPDTGEQALEICEILVRSGAVDVDRDRLGGGARAQGRDRGRDGRLAHGAAGAAHEPGAAQAHRRDHALQDVGDLHQPAAREDRRDVRQSRRRPPAARRSSSTRRCGSTSVASARSRRRRTSSARTCA